MGILDGTGLQYRPARLENLNWLLIVLIPIGPWVSLNCRPLAPSIHAVAMCVHTLSLSVPASQVPVLQMWEELPSTVTHLYSETSWVAKVGKLSFSFREQNGLLDFLYERGPYFPVVCNIPTTTVKMVLLPLSQTHIEESLGHILQAVKITSPRKASEKLSPPLQKR